MKILVCSRQIMRQIWNSSPKIFNHKNNYFITISGLVDNFDWAYPYTGSNVLRLKFDDVTEKCVREHNAVNYTDIILFDEDCAKQIKTFVDRIPKDCTLYVNCAAGISRSGAVGYCINEYVNVDNPEDFEFFEQENKQIQPNPLVKRLLMKEFFGETDWSEVFKEKF